MSWPLELFGTQINTYRAAKLTESAELTYGEAVRAAERVDNKQLDPVQLSRSKPCKCPKPSYNRRAISATVAIEVQQGRGQMMMVMNAQNALINARKALQSNTSDHAVQVYNLLAQMGSLSVENLVSLDQRRRLKC